MIEALCWVAAALALLPAVNTLRNLSLLRTPPLPCGVPQVGILIPARDEENNIAACVDAALASLGADVEVIVMDDGSRDRTAAIVEERAARDPRVRIFSAPPLPPGWAGKQHACHVMSTMTNRPFLLFVDADVRLAPTAAARLVPPVGTDLVSGVPHQRFGSFVETAVVPMINSLIYGYLPVAMMRRLPSASFAAACGQMIMVRTSAYRACGGHAAVASSRHDGLQLPRVFRRQGFRTDLVDGTGLAYCRMYEGAQALFSGFGKNAVEGMAKPVALPIWTALLAGGHLVPFAAVALAFVSGRSASVVGAVLAGATAALVLARALQAVKCREGAAAFLLHPLGIVLTLFIQWRALVGSWRGREVVWRGRSYAPIRSCRDPLA